MTPQVSLIMPVWQPRPEWLRAAAVSALAERDCDLELIVVDDGSEEPVEPLLAELGDSRIRVIRIEHAGPYAARNAGTAVARGAFVRFVDSDDIVEQHSTGRLLALAAAGGEAIAYGATMICDELLTPRSLVSSDLEGDVAEECVMGRFDVYVVSLLFPRSVIERAGAWNEHAFRVSGDWDFVLRTVEQAPVRRLDEVVSRYRRHGDSVTRSASVAAGAAAAELVLAGYFARHPESRGSAVERRAYLRLHLDRAFAHAWVGEWRMAVAQYGRAMRRNPAAAAVAGGRWALARLRGRVARAARSARGGPPSPA